MNYTFLAVLAIAVLVLCWSGQCRATEQLPPRGPVPERPAVCIAPTSSPPTLDGELDDPCWQSAVAVRPFNLSYQGRFSPYEACAMMTYDRDHLYVAMRVVDPDPARDPWRPWPPDRDASVAEFLIDTGHEEAFYKVAVSSKGNVYVSQPMANAVPWTTPPAAVLKRGDNAWTAEFAVPFAGVELPRPTVEPGAPRTPVSWRVNIGWRRPKCTNYSAWAVTHAWFYEPQYYGDLYFGGAGALTAELASVDEPRSGRNPLPVRLSNQGPTPAYCDVVVTLEDASGKRVLFHEPVTVAANASVDVPASYTLADGLTGIATLTVHRQGEAAPFLRQSIPVELPANRQAFRAIQAALATLSSNSNALSKEARKEKASLKKETREFAAALDQEDISRDEWDQLEKPLERFLGRARKLLWQADHAERLAGAPFAVGVECPLRKILRDRAHEGDPAEVIALSAARGEVEGAQLLVIPLTAGLEDLEVGPSPLTGPDGAIIGADNIEVFWTGFVESRTPRYPVEYVGWFADPLIPMDAASRAVPADALHQPLWVSVRVPHNIPAGVYTGQVDVRAACDGSFASDASSWPVTLRLRVYDFDLPTRPALQTSMWLNPSRITEWYGWDEIPKDVLRREMAFLLDHRLNPSWFGPMGDDDDIEWQIERGLNLVMLGVASEWPLEPETEEKITRYYDFFKERGLLDLAFIYGQDEPSPPDYPEVRDVLTKVAERYPGVRRVCTAYPPVPMLEGSVDTWVVGPNLFNYGPVAERVAAGDELWIYLSASVRRPFVTQFYLDYTALENRLIGWYCWKYGATGFLYWGINEWHSNNQPWSGDPAIDDAIRAGKRWPDVPWNTWTYLNCNGDAQYIYPGPNGEFWSSVRMEIIRDSFEDYDYFVLLDNARKLLERTSLPRTQALLADAEELLDVGPPLASDLSTASDDPTELLKRREAVAEHLERILHALRKK